MALNLLAAIDAFRQGREDGERNRLAELDQRGRDLAGQYLQTGDKSLLAQLTATNPALGMRFMEQNEAREDRQADRDWRTAESQRAQSNADRSFGLQQQGFNADEAYRRQQLALEREKLDASANKAPEVVEIYDAQGRPQKAVYNPQTREFDPIGGFKVKEKTVDENKADAILQGAEGSFVPALENYNELGNWQNTAAQVPDVLPWGLTASLPRVFMSSGGQKGQDAVRNVVSNYIYALSGAQAPETEVSRNMALVTPRLTDSAETITAKRARLVDMINTLRARAGQPALSDAEITGGKPQAKSGSAPPANADALIEQANDAIARGADPAKVRARLFEQGVEADFGE